MSLVKIPERVQAYHDHIGIRTLREYVEGSNEDNILSILHRRIKDPDEKLSDIASAARVLLGYTIPKPAATKYIEMKVDKELWEMTPEEKEETNNELKEMLSRIMINSNGDIEEVKDTQEKIKFKVGNQAKNSRYIEYSSSSSSSSRSFSR